MLPPQAHSRNMLLPQAHGRNMLLPQAHSRNMLLPQAHGRNKQLPQAHNDQTHCVTIVKEIALVKGGVQLLDLLWRLAARRHKEHVDRAACKAQQERQDSGRRCAELLNTQHGCQACAHVCSQVICTHTDASSTVQMHPLRPLLAENP
jgi:hypothetical protein